MAGDSVQENPLAAPGDKTEGYKLLIQAAQWSTSRADEASRWMMLRSSWMGAACAAAVLLAIQQLEANPAPDAWGVPGLALGWAVWAVAAVLLAYAGWCFIRGFAPRDGVSLGERVRQLLRDYSEGRIKNSEMLAYELAFSWYEEVPARPDTSVVTDAYEEADARGDRFNRGVRFFGWGMFFLLVYTVIRVIGLEGR